MKIQSILSHCKCYQPAPLGNCDIYIYVFTHDESSSTAGILTPNKLAQVPLGTRDIYICFTHDASPSTPGISTPNKQKLIYRKGLAVLCSHVSPQVCEDSHCEHQGKSNLGPKILAMFFDTFMD